MHPVVFEVIGFIAVVLFLATQVWFPLLRGLPLFPAFKFRKQHQALADAEAEALATLLELKVEAERKRVAAMRQEESPKGDSEENS